MRARLALAVGIVSLFAVRCTAFVASQLSGSAGDGSEGGSPVGASCFHLVSNACGQCIATSCENPNASPPVSLEKVCSLDPYSSLAYSVQQCVQKPGLDNFSCGEMYVDGGTYASTIDTQAAAESNLEHCITDNCLTSCSQCNVSVPTCGSESIALVEAGTCGQCIDQAMNAAGSPCQPYLLQEGACYGTSIGKCAIPPGQCQTADCTDLSSPSSNLDDASFGLYTCLWQQCQGSCPAQ